MNYGRMNLQLLDELTLIVGVKGIITDREKMIDYSHDEFSQESIRHFPDIVVKPENTDQVSAIMKLADRERIPVTARGGGTGLCGACVPTIGGILLSMEKMNRVIEIDTNNLMAILEPGVTLASLYKALEGTGLFFPPHPGDENAMIGGVIATNAGGARAVKYGVIRNFVRGLEVVLANGDIVNLGGKLAKSSTGYSLLNLMVGSEGTLGIITKAIIGLCPEPGAMLTLVALYSDLDKAIATVPKILQNRILPMAVEFLERDTVEVAEDYLSKKWPCTSGQAYLVLIVDASNADEAMSLAEKIGELCIQGGALDIFVADTREKQATILELRSQIYESMRNNMLEILDVTVPPSEIAKFVAGIHKIGQALDIWLPTYGHAADGNVHTNIMKSTWKSGIWTPIPDWEKKYPQARRKIHELGKQLGGIVSGEHGIGLVKKEYLSDFLAQPQIELMKQIKSAFDPKGVLNPGKIFQVG